MERNFNDEESSGLLDAKLDVKTSGQINMEKDLGEFGGQKCILWRGLNLLMAMFFAMAAYVQLNDPDPMLWMFVYSIPATLSLSVVIRQTMQDHIIWQSLATADFCGSLAGVIYLATLIKPHMERESIMNPLTLEEGREASGLIVVMLWIGISKIVSWCNNSGGNVSLSVWTLIVILCLMPFTLWAFCYRTLDKKSLPGHCKDML